MPSRHRIKNSSLVGLRPSTLPLCHGNTNINYSKQNIIYYIILYISISRKLKLENHVVYRMTCIRNHKYKSCNLCSSGKSVSIWTTQGKLYKRKPLHNNIVRYNITYPMSFDFYKSEPITLSAISDYTANT